MGRGSSWGIGVSLLSGEVGAGGGHDHGHEGDAHGHDEDHHDDEMDHADDHDHDMDHDDDHDMDHDDDHDMDHDDDHDMDHDDDHDMDHDDDHDMDHHDDDDMDHHDDDDMDHDHDHEEMAPVSFFSDGVFSGDRGLFGTDFRFAWSPTGNARQSQVILQGEYLWQIDNGVYMLLDDAMEEHELDVDGQSTGWYAQAVYKFAPQWRIGARYAQVSPPSAAEVDHDPSALAIMGDWTSGRFGQVRLQYNWESLSAGQDDDQVILQYTVTLGGHAHHH